MTMITTIVIALIVLEIFSEVIAVPIGLFSGLLWLARLLLRLTLLPFRVLSAVRRPGLRWRMVPLTQKNMTRATFGGFIVALCIGAAASGIPAQYPGGLWALAGIAGLGLLYLCVGVFGSQGARFDVMSVFWWSVGALGCVGALLHFEGMI
jgi:hypothetical protein